MKGKLCYDVVTREVLARHLEQQTILSAETQGNLHIYRCQDAQGESLAVALTGVLTNAPEQGNAQDSDQGIIIRLERPVAPLDRRRVAR